MRGGIDKLFVVFFGLALHIDLVEDKHWILLAAAGFLLLLLARVAHRLETRESRHTRVLSVLPILKSCLDRFGFWCLLLCWFGYSSVAIVESIVLDAG